MNEYPHNFEISSGPAPATGRLYACACGETSLRKGQGGSNCVAGLKGQIERLTQVNTVFADERLGERTTVVRCLRTMADEETETIKGVCSNARYMDAIQHIPHLQFLADFFERGDHFKPELFTRPMSLAKEKGIALVSDGPAGTPRV